MKEPYVIDIFPYYGPEAGGTHILITGALFGANASLTVTYNKMPFRVAFKCVKIHWFIQTLKRLK